MSTPHHDEHMHIPYVKGVSCIHEKTPYYSMCKVATGANCAKDIKGFKQKSMLKTGVKEGKSHVC
jgi:hypothetical protein